MRRAMRSLMPVATTKRARIFINASSGFDEKQDAGLKLQQALNESGLKIDIEYVEKGVNLSEKAREAVIDGYDAIVAGGGDGTLSATAAGLVGTETTFGVLPVGTLNHFARDLGVPLDLEAAARVIAAGHVAHVDVGEVNGKTFLNNAVIGLYPIYRAVRADLERRGWPAKLALVWGWLTTLRKMPFFRLQFFVDGREVTRKTPYVLIGNNEHAMEGWQLGSRSTLNSGQLWVYVLRPQSHWAFAGMALKLILGLFRRHQYIDIFQASEVYVDTRSRRLSVSLDGEIHIMQTPLRLRSLPSSLRVFVPPPAVT